MIASLVDIAAMPIAAAPPGADEVAPSMSLLDYIGAGGVIGYVIILMSIAAFALLVTHIIQIRAAALAPQHAIDELNNMLSKGRVDDAIAFCKTPENECFLTRVVGSGLDRYRRSPFGALELKAALEEAGQEQVARLGRSLDGMALVASIAPMLGLLGTVVGILGAFGTISTSQGFARPDQLAGDISLALVTTIEGLVLAIPATFCVTFFRNRIEKFAADTAVVIDDLAVHLEGARSAPLRVAPPQAPTPPTQATPAPAPPVASPAPPSPPQPTPPAPADSSARPARPAEPTAAPSRRPDHPAGASST
ncbi:MAG: MotA/TolQ/ExbB proton channel family protein [Phycisphaerales bacterium]|nr:MotA/TolQ/ExbB proton channel family protein [Phycisphaerales bacterium]